MITLDVNTIITYTFQNQTEVKGTIDQIEKIATILNENIDYIKLAKENNLVNEYYLSESMGLMHVSDMDTEHLKNALLKAFRTYYNRDNFKDMNLEQFFKAIDKPSDSEIDMLYSELLKRKSL